MNSVITIRLPIFQHLVNSTNYHRFIVVDPLNISRFFLQTHAFSIIKQEKVDSTAQLVAFNVMVTAPNYSMRRMISHTAKLSATVDNEILPFVSTLEYMIHGGIKSTSYDPYDMDHII